MKQDFIHRSELEKVKSEIIADVMSRISIRLEDEALRQLRNTLDDFGRSGGTRYAVHSPESAGGYHTPRTSKVRFSWHQERELDECRA